MSASADTSMVVDEPVVATKPIPAVQLSGKVMSKTYM